MANNHQADRLSIINPPPAQSWADLSACYDRYLALGQKFLEGLRQSSANPGTADWEPFLEQRDDILLNAGISLRRLNEHYQGRTLESAEAGPSLKAAAQLKEIKALDEQLAGLLNSLIADLQKARTAFERGQTILKGYGRAGRRERAKLFEQVG